MNGQRLLTEPEAWREIAKRMDRRRWWGTGLCREVNLIVNEGRVDITTGWAMNSRVSAHLRLGPACAGYAYPLHEEMGEGRQARILAALFFALEAEDDAASTRLAAEIQEGR